MNFKWAKTTQTNYYRFKNVLTVNYFKTITHLRKGNYNKIKPVPGVTKASKIIYTEASCKDFYQKFKSINSSESVPMRKQPSES